MNKKTGYISVFDGSLYYEIAGHGDVVVFIHGDILDTRMWDAQFDEFAKQYTVLRFDMRGFGKSSLPLNSPYAFHTDMFDLLQSLSISKAHFIGCSLGGDVALAFAVQYPTMVQSLGLENSGLMGFPMSNEFKRIIGEMIQICKKGDIEAAKSTWLSLPLFAFEQNSPDVFRQLKDMVSDTSCYRWYGENQPIKGEIPTASRLKEISKPTLIITSEYDFVDFQKVASYLQKEITGSQKITISNAGHLSNMDNPKMFNSEVLAFLKRI